MRKAVANSNSIKSLQLFKRFGLVIIITTVILLSVEIFRAYTDLQLNTSFNQRITAIEPFTTDQDIIILKSKWAMMKTRLDYININMSIERIAKENKIDLPPNLLN